jgi:hypothetical protein
MTLRHSSSLVIAAAMCAAAAIPSAAQTPTVVTPAFDFSGVVFGSYGFRNDSAGKAALGGSSPNQFTLDRAYLTFRMPAGDNGQIRITSDVFQNTSTATNGYYQGWAVRVKYGYLQYTGFKNAFGAGSNLTGRVGVLHTVAIDHEEGFWPRYLNQTAIERNGFFSSADAGVAGLLTLGNKWGEIYGTITNGSGYASYEKDRFKDFAARVSLTPFADHGQATTASAPGAATPSAAPSPVGVVLRTFTISPWFYKGWNGSNFAAGGAGQIGSGDNGAVTDGLQRDRWGIFAGLKERRLTGGVEFAQRMDQSETGANTSASPRVAHDSTGSLIDGFVVARPLEWFDASQKSNWSIVARFDHFTPNTDPTAANYAGETPAYNFTVLGLSYDLTSRMTFTADWQQQSPTNFPAATGTNVRGTPKQSTIFLHWQATF